MKVWMYVFCLLSSMILLFGCGGKGTGVPSLKATSKVYLVNNLSLPALNVTKNMSVAVYDDLQHQRSVTLSFVRVADRTWQWSASGEGVGHGAFVFHGHGVFNSVSGNVFALISREGSSTTNVVIDFSEVTQYVGGFTVVGSLSAISCAEIKPYTTNNVEFGGNLKSDSNLPVVASFSVYDSLGTTRNIALNFVKVAENQWFWNASGDGAGGSGIIDFNNQGQVMDISGTMISVTGLNGSASQAVDLDIRDITQFASGQPVFAIRQDGKPWAKDDKQSEPELEITDEIYYYFSIIDGEHYVTTSIVGVEFDFRIITLKFSVVNERKLNWEAIDEDVTGSGSMDFGANGFQLNGTMNQIVVSGEQEQLIVIKAFGRLGYDSYGFDSTTKSWRIAVPAQTTNESKYWGYAAAIDMPAILDMKLYDSLGALRGVKLSFEYVSVNSLLWSVTGNNAEGTGNVFFSEDGVYATSNRNFFGIQGKDGSASQTISMDFNDLILLSAGSTSISYMQDGYPLQVWE